MPKPRPAAPATPEPPRYELVPVDQLVPYARNARTHDDRQVAQIAGSIREFGFLAPIVAAADGTVIAGHGRLAAAQQLGLQQVPVVRADHLTEAQRRAYALADNRLAENAGWDEALLRVEIADLLGGAPDLVELLGWSEPDLQDILLEPPGPGAGDEDAVQTPPAEPVTRPGDLWLLGPHRLLCGDATSADDVARLLAGARPHLMVTDPPYGVAYDPSWRPERNEKAKPPRRTGQVSNDDRISWRAAWNLFPGDVAYVWCADTHDFATMLDLHEAGFQKRARLIWLKPKITFGRGHYHWRHESCLYAVRKGGKSHWCGSRQESTVWEIEPVGRGTEGEDGSTEHSTQKPVECMRRPIRNNSATGDAVYDPFAGSGSTLVAAEGLGRSCCAMEIDPRYCDVIVQRWQALTGKAAVLDGAGSDFAATRASRGI